ncbi:hypothetical protein ACHHYP_20289, partial [Achlya hypogyna]
MPDHVPVLGTDGTFMKAKEYPGVLLTIIQRDANGHNNVLAVAVVPAETVEHYLWFLKMCMRSGIVFANYAVFADRGKITNAVAALRTAGYRVFLKHCTVHLLRNLNTNFQLRGPSFEGAVWALQATAFQNDYERAISTIAFSEEAVAYLRNLGPETWTVYGNMKGYNVEESRPLFGVRSTNFVESDNAKKYPLYFAACDSFSIV